MAEKEISRVLNQRYTNTPENSSLETKNKGTNQSMYSQIDIDEELDHLVSQIEENTYNILSIKQKFALIQAGGSTFEKESSEKMDKFSSQIQALDLNVNSTFANYNHRIDLMELLAFRPHLYHPSKIITVGESYQITSALYTSDKVLIGTDNSKILAYDSNTLRFMNEIGPLSQNSDNAVIQLGIISFNYNQIIVAATANKILHIFDLNKPQQRISLHFESFATWNTNLTSLYRLALSVDGFIHLYKEETFTQFEAIQFKSQIISPANEGLLCSNDNEVTLFLLDPLSEDRHYIIPFNVTAIAASKEFFVVSGNEPRIAVFSFDNNVEMKEIQMSSTPLFLFAWGSYFFQLGENTLIECFNYLNPSNKIVIGNRAWWPHDNKSHLSSCGISESILVTAQDLTCVIWN